VKKYNIVASLSHGRILSKSLGLFLGIFAFMGIAIVIFALSCWDFWSLQNQTLGAIACIGVGILFFLCGGIMLLRDVLLKRKIRLWLQDAVELKAHSQKFDTQASFPTFNFCYIKIFISFSYNHKKMSRYSGDKSHSGYDTVFYKYADKDIDILYSPKYDEVMILKS
jgi:hypothetical protein